MADVFRVFAYDICTNTRICEVPARALSFDSRLNDAGAIAFTLNLTDPASAAQVRPLMPYLDVAPFALYVDRDGVIVWAGWAKTSHYTHSSKEAFPITGKEWLDYFTQRLVTADYSETTYPNGVDPAQLLALAVTDCQDTTKGGPGASVGISVVGGSSSLPWITPSYTSQSFVSQVIADMTAGVTPGTGGLDVYCSTAWSNGTPSATSNSVPVVTLNVCSPRAGRTALNSGLTFELLNAVDFEWPNDIDSACTTLMDTGGGSGVIAPVAIVQAPGVPVGGLGQPPRLDKVIQHSNILDGAQLSRMAYGEAQAFSPPVATPTVTIRTGDPTNPLGSWIPGDDARLRAPAFERFPGGVDSYWRIVQYATTVPDEGVPMVRLTFNPPPSY